MTRVVEVFLALDCVILALLFYYLWLEQRNKVESAMLPDAYEAQEGGSCMPHPTQSAERGGLPGEPDFNLVFWETAHSAGDNSRVSERGTGTPGRATAQPWSAGATVEGQVSATVTRSETLGFVNLRAGEEQPRPKTAEREEHGGREPHPLVGVA